MYKYILYQSSCVFEYIILIIIIDDVDYSNIFNIRLLVYKNLMYKIISDNDENLNMSHIRPMNFL